LRPVPPGGRTGARGGRHNHNVWWGLGSFSLEIHFHPKIFRQNRFYFGKFRACELSSGTFLDFSNFKPEKTWPEKFQSNFFYDFQLSRQNFSGPEKFTAKKSTQFLILVPGPYYRIYDGEVSPLLNSHPFFQLSRRIFLEFSTFNRKIFWMLKFRAEKNPAKKIRSFQLSNQKILPQKNFEPYERDADGRNFSGGTLPLRRETRGMKVFFRISQAIFRKF
jgi:hypothetical protein